MTPEFQKAARNAVAVALQLEVEDVTLSKKLVPDTPSSIQVSDPEALIRSLNNQLGTDLDPKTFSEHPDGFSVAHLLNLLESKAASKPAAPAKPVVLKPVGLTENLSFSQYSGGLVVTNPGEEASLGSQNLSIKERACKVTAELLNVEKDKIQMSSNFVEDLGADSLDVVELVAELQEEFEINISDESAENIHTLGDLMSYLNDQPQLG